MANIRTILHLHMYAQYIQHGMVNLGWDVIGYTS